MLLLRRLYHRNFRIDWSYCQGSKTRGDREMSLRKKRILILLMIIVAAVILGRLAVRAVMNVLMGGTLFGGNIL